MKELSFNRGIFIVTLILFTIFMLSSMSMSVKANALNGVGQSQQQVIEVPIQQPDQQPSQQQPIVVQQEQVQTTTQQSNSNASSVGNLFSELGVDSESANKAKTFVSPLAKSVNYMFAIILLLASIGLFLITGVDLLYIAVPPLRGLLNSESSGGGGGMYGQPSGNTSGGFRLISDEALSAVSTLQGGSSGGVGGGGFGGGYGGGFGGGFGGGMGASAPQGVTMKSVLFEYTKKRMFFLLMFGVCSVLFSVTIFTDLGIRLGELVLSKLSLLL